MKSLSEIFNSHNGNVSDRWKSYFPVYDRLLLAYRDRPVRILEVGVQNGGSIEIWLKYFEQARKIVGCDVNPKCATLHYSDPRAIVVIGDVNTDAVEREIISHSQHFEIVIDDGSHRSSDIIKTFARYFPSIVDDGIFVVEDLHCSYWQEFEGGLYDPYSSISFFKLLADVVNYEHWGTLKKRGDLLNGIEQHHGITLHEELLSSIHSVEFVNSVCIIRKKHFSHNQLSERVVTGQSALVWSNAKELDNQNLVVPDQSLNYWTALPRPPAELLEEYERSITERDWQIASLNQAVTERDQQIASLNQAVTERDRQIDDLNQSVAAYENSFPFRYLTLIRLLGNLFARFKHCVRLAPAALRIGGGLLATLKIGYNLYRREGRSGLRRGFDFVRNSEMVVHSAVSESLSREEYATWCKAHEPQPNTYPKIRIVCESWNKQPKIAIVMPVYNASESFLTAAIESVLAQVYPHWELCICDDASTKQHVGKILQRYSALDSRIRVVTLGSNGGISMATNEGVSMVTADYLAFLDHDDLLHPLALHYIAEAITENEDADIFYSDEDKLDDDGHRCMPLFKPDWSPHLALSQAYLGHLIAYRSSLVREIGGCRTHYNGAQDYDLWLRASLKARRIVHVPKVLYHWRMHSESTAATPDSKPYAHEAGRRAVESYVKERYPLVPIEVVDGAHTFTYGLKFTLQKDQKVSIIIPTRNRVDLIRPCLQSILEKSTWENFEIIVMDNGSDDPETIEWMNVVSSNDERVRIVKADIPFNWSRLNNIGASQATGDVLVFLNNDTIVSSPDWLDKLAGYALLPDAGVVGALLLFDDGTIQHSGVVVGMRGWADHVYRMQPAAHGGSPFISPVLTRNSLAVTGACAAISTKRFQDLGGFDEEFIVCGSDVELCLRSYARGLYNIIVGDVRLFHFESKSRDPARIPQNDFEQSAQKYEPFRTMLCDPFFNPNLSMQVTAPSFAPRAK